MTEALCLLPPAQRAFSAALEALRSRLGDLPKDEPPRLVVPEPVEFDPLDSGRRVPMHVVGWFCGVVALALMASFAAGFAAAVMK